MDCETFERVVLDRVFLELDELTMGSAQRHVAHCSRCRTIEVGLRATRDVCRLPHVAPMEGFVDCVLTQERQIRSVLPLRQRLNRAVSMLASYAMRPQSTMAALLLLMIGASLFLVRTRPGDRDLVQVTERGVPEVDQESSVNKEGTAPSAMNIGFADSGSNAPLDDAQGLEELEHARSVRANSGCFAALELLETIRRKYLTSDVGLAATWDAAECYTSLERKAEARALFELLVGTHKYAKRAKAQLAASDTR